MLHLREIFYASREKSRRVHRGHTYGSRAGAGAVWTKGRSCRRHRQPLCGRYVEDLQELVDAGSIIGKLLADRAVEALGEDRSVESYGKAAIVGCRGEIEHGAALLHPRMGKPVRAAIGQGLAVIPSATKRAEPGASIDVPLHFKDDE